MKHLLSLATFLFLSTLGIAQNDSDEICKDLSHLIELEQHQHQQLVDLLTNTLTETYDLKYHRLEWTVDPAVNYIEGTITSYFVPTVSDFQQINFDFAANMTVNEVSYHGNPTAFTLLGTDNLQIDLPAEIPIATLDSITVHYEGAPSSSGFGSFEVATHAGVPILWTLSEPYGAKVWWPCKQDLNDKIDSVDIIVRTPAAYRVGSNGILKRETVVGNDKIYHWKHRHPIAAYLISMAVTNYAVFSDYVDVENDESIEILNYVFPESLVNAEAQLGSTVEIMTLYNELFGLYPFADEKYGHAQFGWGGGMEHQTMSSMVGFSFSLQAHELAHQWFGDKVTCGSWTDIWLNEGFATYLTGLTDEFLGTEQAWTDWKNSKLSDIVSQPAGSVWVDDTTSVGRIFSSRLSYSKGAYLLHMLRWKLGDEDFFQGVRNYLDDPQLAYGYAKTIDLQTHLENHSGQNLEEFFNDWFYRQGYPSYHLTWNDLGGSPLVLQISQSTSDPSVGFFEMPLPILVSGQGQDSLLRLDHNLSGQVFEVALPFEVSTVQFDPDLWLISANNTVAEGSITAIESPELASFISVFPNPVQEMLHVNLSEGIVIEQLEIFDVLGKRIVVINAPSQSMDLPTQDWSAGVYHLVFRTSDAVYGVQVAK